LRDFALSGETALDEIRRRFIHDVATDALHSLPDEREPPLVAVVLECPCCGDTFTNYAHPPVATEPETKMKTETIDGAVGLFVDADQVPDVVMVNGGHFTPTAEPEGERIEGRLMGWMSNKFSDLKRDGERGVEFLPDSDVDFKASGPAILILPTDTGADR
jgi:hypothetical protein